MIDLGVLRSEARREQGRRDLLSYATLVNPKYRTPRHIQYLAGLLTAVERGEILKLAISAPPRFGKSRILAHFCGWWLGREPGRNLLLISAGQSLSVRNSKWIRSDLESGHYPWPSEISAESSSVLNWATNTGATVRALSSQATVTGFQADMCLVDDVQPDMMTAMTRDSLEEWLRSVLETRLEPGAPMVMINSRWSTDDIFSRFQQGESADDWTFVNLEAIAETQPDPIGRELGESLWPERWSLPVLEKKRKSVGTMVWESQYQGHPTVEGGRLIKVSDIQEFDFLPAQPKKSEEADLLSRILGEQDYSRHAQPLAVDFLKVVGIDCSGTSLAKGGGSGSYNALVSLVYDDVRGDYFICDVIRKRADFDQWRMECAKYLGMNPPDVCVIENAASGGRLYQALRGMVKCPLKLVEPRLSKEERLLQVISAFEGKKVHVRRNASWCKDYLSELQDFPAGRFSDQLDATVWAMLEVRHVRARYRGDQLFSQQIEQLESNGWMSR
jgi:predicted phage terminase large subunit-like protein